MVNVGFAATAQDQCSGPQPVSVKVFSNESQFATGSGNFSPDASGGAGGLLLRSERTGSGNGRVYLIVASSVDPAGTVPLLVQPRLCHMIRLTFHFRLSRLWLLLLKHSASAMVDQRRQDISRLTVRSRSRKTLLQDAGFKLGRHFLRKKWRPNLNRVIPAVIPVTAANGPPISVPRVIVKRKRLPTRPKDHWPSNVGSTQA